MKKLATLIVSLLFAALLAACSSDPPQMDVTPAKVQVTTTTTEPTVEQGETGGEQEGAGDKEEPGDHDAGGEDD